MDKKFKKLLGEFRALNLPDGEYAIYGSGPMAVRGIKSTEDLDVIVTEPLYQELKGKYPEDFAMDTIKRIKIGEIEFYPACAWDPKMSGLEGAIERAELIDGLRFVLLEDLVRWKKEMARPKDFEHIKMIEHYLTQQRSRD